MPKLVIIYQNIAPLIHKLKRNYFNPSGYFDEIHIFTFDKALGEGEKRDIAPAFGGAKAEFHPIGGFNIHNVYFRRRSILRQIQAVGPDVIRSYSPQIDAYLATYAGRKLGIPVVVSVHGDRDRDNRSNMLAEGKYGHFLISKIHKTLFEVPALKAASHVIAVYEFAAEYAKRYTDSPVTIVYNKVDTDRFSPGKPDDSRQFTVINVGRIMPAKNQEVLIRAMQHIDGKLVLVGDGENLPSMKRLADELGVKGKVEFITKVPNDGLVGHYRSADVYATAIRYGGVAIPVQEAMACGLPVVQCPYPYADVPEFIGEAGLIVDCTPEGFAAGINRLKGDAGLRMRMGAFARQKMLEHGSEVMDRLERQVYEKTIRN